MEFTKRDVLTLIPAALAATPALAGAPALAGNDVRLLQLERRMARLQRLCNTPGLPDAIVERISALEMRLDDEMLATPAAGVDGLMAKWRRLQYWSDAASYGGAAGEHVAAFDDELRRIVGGTA